MPPRKLWLSLVAASVVAGSVTASTLVAGAAPTACPASASLRLVDSNPVTFKGSKFCGHERLRVRASAGGSRRTRTVTSSSRGAFRVRFRKLPYDPCTSSLSASARGADGLRARFKRPQSLCPPPLSPSGSSAQPDDPAPGDPVPAQDRCRGIDDTPGPKPGPQPFCLLP